jgi:hypothetical protein
MRIASHRRHALPQPSHARGRRSARVPNARAAKEMPALWDVETHEYFRKLPRRPVQSMHDRGGEPRGADEFARAAREASREAVRRLLRATPPAQEPDVPRVRTATGSTSLAHQAGVAVGWLLCAPVVLPARALAALASTLRRVGGPKRS